MNLQHEPSQTIPRDTAERFLADRHGYSTVRTALQEGTSEIQTRILARALPGL